MITISEKSRSALLALTELAGRGGDGPVPIMDLADARRIPLHVLEQIFASLRRAGILQSQRGVKGGYSFRRPPSEVTVLELVEVVDGRLGIDAAPDRATSACDWVWGESAEVLAALLGAQTVADVAQREVDEHGAPMFHI